MLVADTMQTEVFTVTPDDPIDRVFFLLHYEKIRHLPVISKRTVVGIVSDRDLYKAIGPKSRSRAVSAAGAERKRLYVAPKKVRHIMRRGVVTVAASEDIGRAAGIMARRKIGALPVVKGSRLVGIITATDVLLVFSKMMASLAEGRGSAKGGG